MTTVIECRSTEQIDEDTLVWAQEFLQKSLNQMCCGKCLFVGKQREEMKALLAECNAYILGEVVYPRSLITRLHWAHSASR